MSAQSGSWYVATGGSAPAGPFTEKEVRETLQAGKFRPNYACWREGMQAWRPLSEIEPFASMIRPSVLPAKPNAGEAVARVTERSEVPLFIPPSSTKPRHTSSGAKGNHGGLWVLAAVGGAVTVVLALVFLASYNPPPSKPGKGAIPPSPFSSADDELPILCGSNGPLFELNKDESRVATGLDHEAGVLALGMWKLTEVGDSHYARVSRKDPNGGMGIRGAFSVDLYSGEVIYQLRKPSIIVDARRLSDADGLNGLTWQGTIRLHAATQRTFAISGRAPLRIVDHADATDRTATPSRPTWSEWHYAGQISVVEAERRNEHWITRMRAFESRPEAENYSKCSVEFMRVAPSDVPK